MKEGKWKYQNELQGKQIDNTKFTIKSIKDLSKYLNQISRYF